LGLYNSQGLIAIPLISILLLLFIPGDEAYAAEITATWDAGGDGVNWNDPLNWDINIVPNNDGIDFYQVVINSATTVSLNVNVSIDALTVGANDVLVIQNTRTLTIVQNALRVGSGTIANSGDIQLNGISTTTLQINGNVALSGGGTVTMGNDIDNRIIGTANTDILTNVDNTIQGSGRLGNNSMGLVNQGTVVANQVIELQVDPSAAGVINTGTMRSIGRFFQIIKIETCHVSCYSDITRSY